MVQSGDRLSARVLRGARGLEAIRPAWEDLARDADPADFHHQYAWYASYVKHLEPDPRSMLFVWVSRGVRTVAILPLKYCKPRRLGALRVLQLPNHDHLCLADALVRRGEDHEAIMNCILQELYRPEVPSWDELQFPEVLAGSAVDLGLQSRSPLFLIRETARASDFIHNSGGYEATMQRLSGSFRRDLRRKLKHAKTSGTLSYRSIEAPEELEEAFRDFMEVEGSGWKGPGGTGTAVNCNYEVERFYRELMNSRTLDAHCVINLLYLDETCIAGEFCIYCSGVLNLLKIGYLEAYARISPGSLLFDCVLRDWCERSDVRTVSLVGDAAWQKTWHPEEIPVFRYRLYNHKPRALVAWLWRFLRAYLVRVRNRARRARSGNFGQSRSGRDVAE